MICRLCLSESQNYLQVFTDIAEVSEAEVVRIIAKYFCIEMRRDDTVSTMICTGCWNQVYSFHKFWLCIAERQEALRQQWVCPQIKPDDIEVESAVAAVSLNDNKDYILCKPEIDIYTDSLTDTALIDSSRTKQDEDEDGAKNESKTKPKKRRVEKLKRKTKSGTSKIVPIPRTPSPPTTAIMKSFINVAEESDNSKTHGNHKIIMKEMDAYIAQNTQLSCCICTELLRDFNHVKKHYRQEHQSVGYVVCCEKRFRNRTRFVDHLKLHNNPDYFKCTICNKTMSSRFCYDNHMDTLHPTQEKLQFQCQMCPRKFSKQYILDKHFKSRHTTDRNHQCGECNKAFRNSAILRQHLKAVHRNEFGSVCEVCGKKLKTAQNLLTHMEAIHNYTQKPEVQCTICFKWLKDTRCLAKHMIMHQDKASGQEFKCNQCDIVKTTRHALSAHVRYYHSFKVYKCTICDKQFKRPSALEEHVAVHNDERPHTCPFCPKTFRSTGNMYKHMGNSHSKEWVRKHTQPCEYTVKHLNEMQPPETESIEPQYTLLE